MGSKNSDTDVRLMRRLKRRRLDIVPFDIPPDNAFNEFRRNHQMSNEMVDIDYKKYLCGFRESGIWTEHVTSENSNDNEIVEVDDEDPNYKSFLDNLKGDGSFYALQVVEECRPLLLKYHVEVSDDELEFPSPRPLRKVPEKGQVDYKRKLRSNMNKDKVDYKKKLMSNMNKDKREIQKSTTNALAKDKVEKEKSRKNVLATDKEKTQKSAAKGLSKDKEIQKHMTNVLSKGMPGSLKNMDKVTHQGPHGFRKKHDVFFQTSAPHGNHQFAECNYEQESEIPEVHRRTCQSGFKHEVRGDQVDECYRIFLRSLVTEGDSLVFKTNDGIRVRYEVDDDDSSSDSEVLVATNAFDLCKGTTNHFESSRLPRLLEEDGKQCLVDSSTSNYSNFRKTLIEKLRQPYDQVEHDRLWENLTDRKFKTRHIDLRGRGSAKTFATDECNESYLDTYSTLKSKIDAVGSNRHKVLNLMRGFFFWLEHLAHGDQFQPWRDDMCLAVMPGSR